MIILFYDDSIPYDHNHADGQGNNHIILHSDNHDTISYDMILTVSMLIFFPLDIEQ